jgi:hypothetical protein
MCTKTLTLDIMARDKDSHENFIAWYKFEFGFMANAATALYDVQMLKNCLALSKLDDEAIANMCKAVGKDTGHSVAKIAATRLKLVCFWIKHQYRTSREIGTIPRRLVKVTLDEINVLQTQKHNKDNWASKNKKPEYTPLTLDTASATTKAFDKVKNILT